jgi:head-tail adaptor
MPDIAGMMRHRVAIMRATEAEGAVGRKVGVRIGIATRWASVRPDRGTTALEGGQPVDRCDLIVTMRADSVTKSLTIEDRLEYLGGSYIMRTIEPPNPSNGRITVYCVREADPT